jgi:pimeloyl-ACP methyl ester carboxylesterase
MEKIFILNKQKEKLAGILHKSKGKRLVIVCHGHTGNKDRPVPKAICEAMQKAGWNAFRFDFSGNGESEGRFEDSSFTKCARDLGAVVDHFSREGYNSIGVMGHSMGASACVLEAARDRSIGSVVSISSPARLSESFKDLLAHSRTRKHKGEVQLYREGTKEWLTMSKGFLKDLKRNKPLKSVKRIRVPILFAHGTEDVSVPVRDSEELFVNANIPKELVLIHGADHCFTGKGQLKALVKEIVGWVKRLN